MSTSTAPPIPLPLLPSLCAPPRQHQGIIPRTLSHVFNEFRKRSDYSYQMHVSYLEIYNNDGYDLLDPTLEDQVCPAGCGPERTWARLRQGADGADVLEPPAGFEPRSACIAPVVFSRITSAPCAPRIQ